MKILGIDLGTASIGTAYIDTEKKKIDHLGVHIFEASIRKKGNKESSLNEERRAKRGARRVLQRRKQRKNKLIQLLARYGMAPLTQAEAKEWVVHKDGYNHQELAEWLRQDPYQLRARGVKEELSLKEVGRALYHMAQRRGFQSNRKNRLEDKEKNAIYYGSQGKDKDGDALLYRKGILEVRKGLEQGATLGSLLYDNLPQPKEKYKSELERVRGRYTERQMYIDEFDRLWEQQAKFHPQLIEALRAEIGGTKKEKKRKGILFYQAPLKSQKHLVGKCTQEPKKSRCPKSHPLFEEFRAYSFVNKIQSDTHLLTQEERTTLAECLLQTQKEISFESLKKKIKQEKVIFNYDYDKEKKVIGSPTTYSLRKLYKTAGSDQKGRPILFFDQETKNKKPWQDLSHQAKDRIWHAIYTYDDDALLKEHAEKHFKLTSEEAVILSKIHLKPGYAQFSKKVLRATLPFLRKGYQESDAIVLAGVANAFNVASQETGYLNQPWDDLEEAFKEKLIQEVVALIKATRIQRADPHQTPQKGGFMPQIKEFLQKPPYNLSEKALEKLYHHSLQAKEKSLSRLPTDLKSTQQIQALRNPGVVKTLLQLRKVYNAIVQKYGAPDQIHLELARDLKKTKKEKKAIEKQDKANKKENDAAKEAIIEKTEIKAPRQEDIIKYKLWKECSGICPYTFKNIPLKGLFTNDWHREHIIPRSRSLNDSFSNRTLCYRDFNIHEKQDLTPYEYFQKKPEKYPSYRKDWESYLEELKAKTKLDKNNPSKFRLFVQKETDQDLASRHLNDTKYISRQAVAFLKQVCSTVQTSKGQVTSELRFVWGFNKLLHPEGKNEKNRDDHRHHALDALVLAATTPDYVHRLSLWRSQSKEEPKGQFFPKPWSGIEEGLREKLATLLVNYIPTNKVLKTKTLQQRTNLKKGVLLTNYGLAARGQLHEESYYGKHQTPAGKEHYHIRKAIASFSTKKQVEKIVDLSIRKQILERVVALGEAKGEEGSGSWVLPATLPKNTFYEKKYHIEYKGAPLQEVELYDQKPYQKESLKSNCPTRTKQVIALKNKKEIDRITDSFIKEKVEARIKQLGGYQGKESLLPHNTFSENVPTIFLPNRQGGQQVPIRKVRSMVAVAKQSTNSYHQIHLEINRYVKPGNNYCYLIYQNHKGKKKGKVISFIEAIELHKKAYQAGHSLREEILNLLPEKSTLCFLLHKGDFILATQTPLKQIDWQDQATLSKELYRVKKISNGEIFLLHHTTASFRAWSNKDKKYTGEKTSNVDYYKYDSDRDSTELVLKKAPKTLEGIQIALDYLGNIYKHPIYKQ